MNVNNTVTLTQPVVVLTWNLTSPALRSVLVTSAQGSSCWALLPLLLTLWNWSSYATTFFRVATLRDWATSTLYLQCYKSVAKDCKYSLIVLLMKQHE